VKDKNTFVSHNDTHHYSLDKEFEVLIQDAQDIEVYGWVIEECRTTSSNLWERSCNHRLYTSKEVAMEASLQMSNFRNNSKLGKWEYRVIPLYAFDTATYRNYLIEKITN